MVAVTSHTFASATCSSATDQALSWKKTSPSGSPETSESTSGIIVNPISAMPSCAQPPVRDAMIPSTVSCAPFRSAPSPRRVGGISHAVRKNDPTDSANSSQATPRNTGRPAVVNAPGSGMPSALNDAPANDCATAPATTAAITQAATYTGQAGRTARLRTPTSDIPPTLLLIDWGA